MKTLTFLAARAQQSADHQVLTFAATAEQVLSFSRIERLGRDVAGQLSGFQRPQIASHIREIQDYLERPDAVLPNAVVVAFTGGVSVEDLGEGIAKVTIDVSEGGQGLVVDGQQRLTALGGLQRRDFQIFVSALVCRDEAELRRQFVLINNTRPLPKSLVYELLPTVDGLPQRMENRSVAATLTARLNCEDGSFLQGQIYQHTNPAGVIRDTAIQAVLMSSLNDGVMREMIRSRQGERRCVRLASDFYRAVAKTFESDWYGQTPKTSRLIHGAGIQSLGYVMEILAALDGARTFEDFRKGLACLQGETAWKEGVWDFGGGDVRHWRAIQNIGRDIATLAHHLISIVRADIKHRHAPAGTKPLLDAILERADS